MKHASDCTQLRWSAFNGQSVVEGFELMDSLVFISRRRLLR